MEHRKSSSIASIPGVMSRQWGTPTVPKQTLQQVATKKQQEVMCDSGINVRFIIYIIKEQSDIAQ